LGFDKKQKLNVCISVYIAMACSIYYTSFAVALPVVVVTTAVAVVVLRFGIVCKDPRENRSNLLVATDDV